VQDVDKLANNRKWEKVKFFHAEYEYINGCAYFDYQRDKVFVRTSQILRKRSKKARSGGRNNRKLRVTQSIQAKSSFCPFCKSERIENASDVVDFDARKPRIKHAFDLNFTPGSIRRKIIESRSSAYRCLDCGRTFIPLQHDRLDKHFHGLKSWAMYLHVAHEISFGTITTLLDEFFGVWIPDPEVHSFKSLMAIYYRTTYENLLAKILTGNVVHIDETEVKLRVGKGYVWVLTSLEEVVFMYRPNREGDFLKDLLKDFKGVLVTDFYAAYDSLCCPQQKCLIHLIRDMNQELLNSPYDSELQMVTQPFGRLLQKVVGTVDEHGLKKSHLHRHQKEVTEFFVQLDAQSFQSDAAESLRARLLKNRDKLFTFIGYDGVPWNNNNAENAIKRFAYYREGTVGLMKEMGLQDYLVLLSVCHTCRFKGVSFLKFMLSRDKDMDVFCDGKRKKKRLPTAEVYPEGYLSFTERTKERAKVKKLNSEASGQTKDDAIIRDPEKPS
jgi:hypothetical protein